MATKKPRGAGDPTQALERDHREVEALFARFSKAKSAHAQEATFLAVKEALSLHGLLEEAIFYPAVAGLPGMEAKELVGEAVHEHMDVKTYLAELDAMSAESPSFEPTVLALKEAVAHHVEEEESRMFPLARKLLGPDRLAALGDRMARAKAARESNAPPVRAHRD
jgi:hypothetical protein